MLAWRTLPDEPRIKKVRKFSSTKYFIPCSLKWNYIFKKVTLRVSQSRKISKSWMLSIFFEQLNLKKNQLTPPQKHLTVRKLVSCILFSLYGIKVRTNVKMNNITAPKAFSTLISDIVRLLYNFTLILFLAFQ